METYNFKLILNLFIWVNSSLVIAYTINKDIKLIVNRLKKF